MLMNNAEYLKIIDDIRLKIRTAQHRAVLAANGELIALYWNIKGMVERDIEKPIGVSESHLFDTLPEKYENVLPMAEDIERRIGLITENN